MPRFSVANYAQQLLDDIGAGGYRLPQTIDPSPAQLWAESGAMWLSGYPDAEARACPAPLAACARGAWLALAAITDQAIDPQFPAHQLLGERAAIAGLSRRGRQSAGGACHLLATADGVIALNLAREDDIDLLPAWLQVDACTVEQLPDRLRQRTLSNLLQRGRLLGLAVAPMHAPQPCTQWFRATTFQPRYDREKPPLVIDLSALWAGPLCGQLLRECGARVIKVESQSRPDGARSGPASFFDLMNSGKASLALDLRSSRGREQLRRLLQVADIVIESSRPRALQQLGIVAEDLLSEAPGKVWLSITGYGRAAPMADWIAYGDDAGVAAGLSWLLGGDRGDPVFCGDAIADPLTGLHAAVLAFGCWLQGGGKLLDVCLRDVLAYCVACGGTAGVAAGAAAVSAAPPIAREPAAAAAGLGADSADLLAEFGL